MRKRRASSSARPRAERRGLLALHGHGPTQSLAVLYAILNNWRSLTTSRCSQRVPGARRRLHRRRADDRHTSDRGLGPGRERAHPSRGHGRSEGGGSPRASSGSGKTNAPRFPHFMLLGIPVLAIPVITVTIKLAWRNIGLQTRSAPIYLLLRSLYRDERTSAVLRPPVSVHLWLPW